MEEKMLKDYTVKEFFNFLSEKKVEVKIIISNLEKKKKMFEICCGTEKVYNPRNNTIEPYFYCYKDKIKKVLETKNGKEGMISLLKSIFGYKFFDFTLDEMNDLEEKGMFTRNKLGEIFKDVVGIKDGKVVNLPKTWEELVDLLSFIIEKIDDKTTTNQDRNRYLHSLVTIENLIAANYKDLMSLLYAEEQLLKNIDDSRKKIIIDKNKDIVGGASLLDTLIVEPKNKFMSMTNSFLNDKKLVIKDMAILRELLNNIMYTDISKDYNKFKALSNEIFRIIKRNSFNDELLEEVKVELRGEIKSYEDFLERLRNKNKVLENKELKLGDRKERINEYKKDKLKQKIKIKKSSLSSESKLWIDILVDQLLAFDKDMIDNFKTDYKSYLPVENNDINEIIDVVIKQLEYKDADEDIIDTLKYISL